MVIPVWRSLGLGVRTGVAIAALLVATLGSASGWYAASHVSEPLRSAGVGIAPDGTRVFLAADGRKTPLVPGTRVLATSDPRSEVLAAQQREWLAAGTIPGPPEYRDLARDALLDLHTLTLDDGAAVAGWPSKWRYVWPRDSAMVATALDRTGHPDEALAIMRFLQSQLGDDDVFQARYRPEGLGPPDDRGEQSDGAGRVLWAIAQIVEDMDDADRSRALNELRPMIDRLTSGALRLTDTTDSLPPPSQDYWEVDHDTLSLGTAAPIAIALESAARLYDWLGEPSRAARASNRADQVREAIDASFGPDYPRYLGDDKPDAAVAVLLPPFTDEADPSALSAWERASQAMRRPAGGLAPGAGWKNDGISWTPQTALFGLTAASAGQPDAARARLDWIAAHRTRYGAIPEKVLHNGEPAGPAPLGWSAALVLLTLDRLDDA